MSLKMETRVTEGVTVVSCTGRIVFGDEDGLVVNIGALDDVQQTKPTRQSSEIAYEDVAGFDPIGRSFVPKAESGNFAI